MVDVQGLNSRQEYKSTDWIEHDRRIQELEYLFNTRSKRLDELETKISSNGAGLIKINQQIAQVKWIAAGLFLALTWSDITANKWLSVLGL